MFSHRWIDVSPLDEELDRRLASLADPQAAVGRLEAELRRRRIFFGEGQLLPTFLRPHLLPAARHDRYAADTEAMFAVLERIGARVTAEPELASLLGFDEQVLELFRIDPGYQRRVIVARSDAATDGDEVRFIEINCDSPAMMTFADEVEEILLALPPLDEFAGQLAPARRTHALHEALLACYRERDRGSPTIAIVDWPGEKTAHELAATAVRFGELGTETLVAGPAELSYAGGRLSARGRPVDLVYRRVLFRDFLTRKEELAPLLSAYRDGAVCMANPLGSYAVGTKTLLALLHDEDNPAGLTPAERLLVNRMIPKTVRQRGRAPGPEERAGWVLKKAESYGGKDVAIGALCSEAEWASALDAAQESPWVRQQLVSIPTARVPALVGGRFDFSPKYLNWNPFVFGGRPGGSIARVSDSALINITRGGGLLPTMRIR